MKQFLLLAVPSHQVARDALFQAAGDRLVAAHLMEHVSWIREASQMQGQPAASKVYCVPHAYRLLEAEWKVLIAEMKIDLVEMTSVSIRELVRELQP